MDNSTAITVLVRDGQQIRQVFCPDDWDATTMMAAVSSDPRSLRELGLAWLRYRGDSPLDDLPWQPYDGKPPAGNWLVIDLACQRLVSNVDGMIPDDLGGYQKFEGKWNPDIPVVWCNFPPWWQRATTSSFEGPWPEIPEPREPVDFRGVLYGRAMTDALADRIVDIAAKQTLPDQHICGADLPWDPPPSDEQKQVAVRWHQLTVQVHADWLMTPRDDLEGRPPRTYLHQGREWVEAEVTYRERQWSDLKTPPRALDRNTHAYRHGPMGRDEVVIYFDLCREVIHAGWRLLSQQPLGRGQLSAALYQHSQRWLESGSIDGEPTPPAAIIESSRRHMPRLSDGSHLDCDCPLCRMMMDNPEQFYPTFSGFDGHHLELDDEFAFSLYESREEWEAEQESFRELSERLDRKEEERAREKVADLESQLDAWSRQHVDDDLPF